uniref:Uncharacterized protein n=1 Tax=Grammatophora oceanica TaxID=210454 RepID=A0A7S1Y8S5_9STRA|mmetsp:Transcript_37433/g.55755  ORF Transcript_37433/g.55755 Transcript_37433/m.55755 type:complete len:369 (+) Transcript_37433:77-1183(+)|eukprot:CAMPEP_0194048166 /NCGR_PEP_ID=MMETSP0009_2-20130614/26760_1 /TAXON_ID=210454 /ORGANISM="Grammatophora oceanica, Strain CCMP 410" /LENGTH=368 /DNA_ID=CAMNT_0038693981 /DNA_START=69 /DNA_END=1175 /DNA_ORIENTATION=+
MRVSISLCLIAAAVGIADAFNTVVPLTSSKIHRTSTAYYHGARTSNTAAFPRNRKLNVASTPSKTTFQPIQQARTFLEDSGIGMKTTKLYQPIQEVGKFVREADNGGGGGITMKASNFIIRVANHLPTLGSLFCFGLNPNLKSVLTANVGPTLNGQFAALFPTLVTPPNVLFFGWPLIATVQVLTLAVSSFVWDKPLLDQDNLSALFLANLASASWLFALSVASEGMLPLGATLILPLVPILASYPLRKISEPKANRFKLNKIVFQLFSAFTIVGSLIAFAVELQHGGRIPFFTGRPEVCAGVFLVSYFIMALRGGSLVKRFVNAAAICEIVAKRVGDASCGTALLGSPSFFGTLYVAYAAVGKLFSG